MYTHTHHTHIFLKTATAKGTKLTMFTTTYIGSNACSVGTSTTSTSSSTSSVKQSIVSADCFAGVKEACVVNPDVENWPGYGLWENANPSGPDPLGTGMCSEATGPDHVVAFPNTCMTNGQTSWKYTCDAGSSAYIQKDEYKSTDCTGSLLQTTYVGAPLYKGGSAPVGKCLEVSEATSSAYRAFYSCSVKSIPGVTDLPKGKNCWAQGTGPQNQGCGTYTAGHYGTQSGWLVGGLAVVLLVSFFFLFVCIGCVWYYYHTVEQQRKADAFQNQAESAKTGSG